jgi:CBS-domain-containing membrane protein
VAILVSTRAPQPDTMITPTVPTPAVPITGPTRIAPIASSERREAAKTWRGRTRFIAGDAVWGAAMSAILILVVGALTLATSQPWLFAALGPSAVVIASSPGQPSSRFHSVVVGHLSALLCAWLVVVLVGASGTGMSSDTVGVARVWASAMAVAVTTLVQPSLRAYHPPSAATALLITLGMYHLTWKSSLSMMGGVVIVALMGEWFQRIRLKDEPARR